MYLLDTDFLIASHFKGESTSRVAHNFAQANFSNHDIFYIDQVVFELATVISHKYSQKEAIEVSHDLRSKKKCILSLNKYDLEEAWQIFDQQKKKGCSFVDCANLAIAKSLGLKIVSFDKFYKKFGVDVLQ